MGKAGGEIVMGDGLRRELRIMNQELRENAYGAEYVARSTSLPQRKYARLVKETKMQGFPCTPKEYGHTCVIRRQIPSLTAGMTRVVR